MLPIRLERKISRISAWPSDDLLELRLEHALEGRLDLLDGLVDHRVVPDLDALAVGQLRRLALRADVEADDDGVGRRGQVDVGLGDRTDTAVDDPQATSSPTSILASESSSASTEPDTSPLRIRWSSWLSPFSIEAMKSSRVRRTRRLACIGRALARLALLGDLPGHPVVLDDDEVLAGTGHRGQTEHHRRTRRVGLLDVLAVLVEHGPDPAVGRTGDDRVADPERAALDEHGRDRTAATVEVRLDRRGPGRSGRGWPAGPATRRRSARSPRAACRG